MDKPTTIHIGGITYVMDDHGEMVVYEPNTVIGEESVPSPMDIDMLDIYRHFGTSAQMDKLSEEVSELQCAVKAYDVGTGTFDNMVEEFSDVQVMMAQIALQYHIPASVVDRWMQYKVARTVNRYDI